MVNLAARDEFAQQSITTMSRSNDELPGAERGRPRPVSFRRLHRAPLPFDNWPNNV